jgi:stage V sporulation protein D (sporulation-specific penicillin-binding protein)
VDNPKGTVQFGGVVAAPIVGNIMEDSLRAMGVKPRKNQIEKETVWTDPVMVEVPDVVGLSKKELQTQLIDLKLDIAGNGDKVINQAPDPGVKVKQGSTIRIYLGENTE